MATFAPLTLNDQANHRARSDLASAELLLGEVLIDVDHPGEATAALERSVAESESTLGVNPSYMEARRVGGIAWAALGYARLKQRKVPAALESFARALALLDVEPIRSQADSDVALLYLRMGDAHEFVAGSASADLARQEREQAASWYAKSREAFDDIAKEGPLSPRDQVFSQEALRKSSSRSHRASAARAK
jgi:tetratricopeptide (TPR) repeat protein